MRRIQIPEWPTPPAPPPIGPPADPPIQFDPEAAKLAAMLKSREVAGYELGKADAAITERNRTNAAFFSAVILCLALGFAAGFSLASNLAEPQQVAEVGE